MKTLWLLIVLLSVTPLCALQGSTPQAALEEIATTTKPEVLARHLPAPVEKQIAELPRQQKQEVLEKLLAIKSEHLNDCTVRPAQGSEGWEIIDGDGNSKGKVKLDNAFFSGSKALLPLELELEDGRESFIVTMHLEDSEWRIDDLGPWEKNDLGLEKLLHQPTEMEKNEAAALSTLRQIGAALRQYSIQHGGLPPELSVLTEPADRWNDGAPVPYLEKSFAADPLIKDGYRFHYVRIAIGGDGQDFGKFEVTATPVEFSKTGSKNFLGDFYQVHVTSENRPATAEDPLAGSEDGQVVVMRQVLVLH